MNKIRIPTIWKLLMLIVLWMNVNPHSHKHFLLLTNCVEAVTQQQQQQQQQQPKFAHTTTTLSQSRAILTSISLGELVFFAGGGTGFTNPSDRVDMLNVTSGVWTTFTLSVSRGGLAATSVGNLVFFGGGTDSLNPRNVYDRVDIYNTSTGSWSTSTLSVARAYLAATSVGDLVFFGGGYTSTNISLDVVDVYNATSNRWTNTTLSVPRYLMGATSVANRYVLFGGGRIQQLNFSDVVDIFDSLSGMWNTTTLSQARGYLTATSLGNLAFFGGGNATGGLPSNVVDIFNSTSQTWINTTLSQARSWLASSSIGEIVVIGGGTPDGLTASSIVDLFNLTSNTWFNVTLSQPRGFLASTSSNNKIFFGGGLSNTGLSNIVDIFDFSSSFSESNSTIDTTSSPSNSLMSSITGAIAGIVVGIVVILIGVSVIIWIVILKRKRKRKQKQKQKIKTPTNQPSNVEKYEILQELTKITSLTKETHISFNELVVEKEIGEGSYGKVCLGRWNNGKVALKFCRNKSTIDDFVSEIKIMIELPPHPNVVQVFGVSLDGPQPVIIMEYCLGGSLDKLLFDLNVKFSIEKKIEMIRGIAAGLLHLHKHNIVRRDLAARNILLSGSVEPKISDFGMSRILEERKEGKTYSNVGPIRWMSPESIGQHIYSKQSDVWTFGIVVWEIIAQSEPHTTVDPVDVGALIRDQGLTPTIPNDCPPFLQQLMEMCWKKDPDQRPTMETVLFMLKAAQPLGTG